jgi:hypothetical protein
MKRLLLAATLLVFIPRAEATELSPLLGTMNADNVTLYPGLLTYPNGGFHPMGVIYTITTPVATAAGTGAQTLGTFALPANSFDAAGRKVRISAAITTAANTNTKTCTLNFGSESISTGAMATSGETATLSLVATKTGSSTQVVWGNAFINTTVIKPVVTTGAETDTAAITLSAICTDGTNSAGDATLQDFYIEYMN